MSEKPKPFKDTRSTMQKLRDTASVLDIFPQTVDQSWVVRARKRQPTKYDDVPVINTMTLEHINEAEAYVDAHELFDAGYSVIIHRYTVERIADLKIEQETKS